jgi:multisubunit Na+/H+ antiporter MnhB subunit
MDGKLLRALAMVALFAAILAATAVMRPFGKPEAALMDDYFIENGQAETGSNNIVASVLFDYRSLDTLGEATVLFAAAMGVYLVFRREPGEKRK